MWIKSHLYATLLFSLSAHADITLDSSYGRNEQPLNGPHYAIPAAIGVQTGTHLFHSFGAFNLAQGESATFSGDASITRIFSRVTGGSASQLDGLLRSSIAGADLYFFNPAGVIFGPNARLDVQGSFYASTAAYLDFSDGSRWLTAETSNAVFTTAEPTAFGFLDSPPAALSKQHSLLNVPAGETLALLGGDITLHDTAVTLADDRIASSFIAAPGGQLTVVSATANQRIPHDLGELTALHFHHGGTVTVHDANPSVERGIGNLHSSGAGGQILIRAGQLYLDNAYLFADTTGDTLGRGVDIQTADHITLTGNARITAEALGAASAGDIRLHTQHLNLNAGSQIVSATRTAADAGDIYLTAQQSATLRGRTTLTLSGEPLLFSSGLFSNTFGSGTGGDIVLNTSDLNLSAGGEIRAATLGLGAAGAVTLNADWLHLSGGAQINVNSGVNGLTDTQDLTGDAGALTIRVQQSVELRGAASGLLSNSFTDGRGGNIHLLTPQLRLYEDATIQAGSTRSGDAGQLIIEAQRLTLDHSQILTQATQAGGGDIILYAVQQIYLHDSRISAAAGGASPQHQGGNVNVAQPEFLILANSELLATAFVGNGGDITLVTDNLIRSGDSRVDASSQLGVDGQILVTAPDKQLDASLIALSGNLPDAAGLIRERCNPWQKAASRFYLIGPTGLPAMPGTLLEHSGLTGLPAMSAPSAPVTTTAEPSVPRAWLLAQCQPTQRST